MSDDFSKLDPTKFKAMIQKVAAAYPNFKAVATTLRGASGPTSTGLPRSSGLSNCSIAAKNASISTCIMTR